MKFSAKVTISRKIVVNGVEYHSLEELPPDIRAAVENATAMKTEVPAGVRELFLEEPEGASARWILAGLAIGAALAAWLWIKP